MRLAASAGAVVLCAVLAALAVSWRVPQDLDTAERAQIALHRPDEAIQRLAGVLE